MLGASAYDLETSINAIVVNERPLPDYPSRCDRLTGVIDAYNEVGDLITRQGGRKARFRVDNCKVIPDISSANSAEKTPPISSHGSTATSELPRRGTQNISNPIGHSYDNKELLIEMIWAQHHAKGVMSTAFNPDGTTVASYGHDDAVKFWDVDNGALKKTIKINWLGEHLRTLSRQQMTEFLASSSGFDALSMAVFQRAIALSSDGTLLAVGLFQGIEVWDLRKFTVRYSFSGHSSWVTKLAFSHNGRYLASASSNSWSILIWDLSNGQKLPAVPTESSSIQVLDFRQDDGSLLAFSGGTLQVIDVPSLKVRSKLEIVHALASGQLAALSPDQRLLITSFKDDGLDLWRVSDGGFLQHIDLPPPHGPHEARSLDAIAVSPDNSLLAMGITENNQIDNGLTYYFDALPISSSKDVKELTRSTYIPGRQSLGMIDTISFSSDAGSTLVHGSSA
jgi:WD40 repeat protein